MTSSSQSDPIVSVVMPVRNGGRLLIAAIESIRSQTLPDFELIVVDDGSTDETAEILRRFQERDSRIKIISHSNRGISPSLNAGIAAARGEFIARQDADDTSHPLRLEEQVRYFSRSPGSVLCTSWVRFINDRGEGFLSFRPAQESHRIKHDLTRGLNPIVHGSVMLRRAALLQFDKPYRGFHGEDLDLWLRLLQIGSFGTLDRERYFYRVNTQGISLKNLATQRALREYIYFCHQQRLRGVQASDDEYEKAVARIIEHGSSEDHHTLRFPAVHQDIRDALRADDPQRLRLLASGESASLTTPLRIGVSLLSRSRTLRALLRFLHDWGRGLKLVPIPSHLRAIPAPWLGAEHSETTNEFDFDAIDTRCCIPTLPVRVSVVMAVRDEQPLFLVNAIESILGQTLTELECIIVDDGSVQSETLDVLRRYERISNRIHVVPIQKVGLTRALNIGMRHAKSSLIARQDSDDWSAPTRLAHQIRYLAEHPRCGIVGSYATICNGAGDSLWIKKIRPSALLSKNVLRVNPVAHGSLCMRAELLQKLNGYDERFDYAQDYDLLVRAQEITELGIVNQPLYFLRKHSAARSVLRFAIQRRFSHAANHPEQRDALLAQIQNFTTNGSSLEASSFDSQALKADMALINKQYGSALRESVRLACHYPFTVKGWGRVVRSLLFPLPILRPYLFR